MRTMLLTAGLAVMFAQGTARPGDIPRPDVWIKNSAAEPIPIDVREMHLDAPLRVLVLNGEANALSAAGAPIRVRAVPPVWSYRTVTIASALADPATALQSLGADGWETTGVSWTRGQETVVLLKRPR